ncbi:MAG: iron-containing alcohol dehydrogenase [Firmicutes bacterium]|nr:iron-containing alcohol dehydrogenase [Bacillota bacterium]
MIRISKTSDQGVWSVPGIVDYDESSGNVEVNRKALPQTAERIIFGRDMGLAHLGRTIRNLPSQSSVLAVVGASSSRSPQVRRIVESLQAIEGSGGPDMHRLEVQGHANHDIIRAGIGTAIKVDAAMVLAMGGGTTLDVGKAVAGLAFQDGGADVAAFQLKAKAVDPKLALPWIALPTTSGTGSESSNNAVVELGEEKRSIRPIPSPSMIIADPSLTDSLPFRPTVTSSIDALAQSLEIFTSAKASREVQAVALAATCNLVEGLNELQRATERLSSDTTRRQEADGVEGALGPDAISARTRNLLSWGSMLMGIAFTHAHLGLPHALVHHCIRFGLSHGNMVGILLAPGLTIQAQADSETARRLHVVQKALPALGQGDILELSVEGEDGESRESGLQGHVPDKLIAGLRDLTYQLFTAAGLPTSLRSAGLTRRDLDWIATSELHSGASFGIPNRPATRGELLEVLEKAF